MSQTTENSILKALSGKHPDDVTYLSELKAITAKYPAFGVAKYLLVKKMLRDGAEGVEKHAQNAVLYFADPFWFHFKLNEETLIQGETFLASNDRTYPYKVEAETGAIEPEQEIQHESIQIDILASPTELPGQDAITKNADANETLGETPAVETAPAAAEEVTLGLLEDFGPNAANSLQATSTDADEAIPTVGHIEETPAPLEANIAIAATPTPLAVVTEAFTAQPKFVFDNTAENGEDNGLAETDEEMQTQAQPFNNDRINTLLQEQLADFNKPIEKDTPVPIESEPYHTVDYFASQGIKLTQEQQAQDHLSVKVKKFTDWLKQMKRIAPQPTDLGIDEAAEHKVKNIAAGSNQADEVVTETMAEVLVKQGMHEKAIEVYEKLSFLYPAKSTYFATQIEHLKTN